MGEILDEQQANESKLKEIEAKLLEKHESNINRINVSIQKLESEMKSPLKNKLSDEEEEKKKKKTEKNEKIQQKLAKIVVEIAEIEMKKSNFESSLRDNLNAQLKDLQKKLKKCNAT